MKTLGENRPVRRGLAALALALAGTGCDDTHLMTDSGSQSPPAFLLGGIQVNEADLKDWFDALADQSMNTVHVTEYARQGDWDSDDISWDEVDADVLDEIRGAERRGLAVVYICRIHLDPALERNNFLWHGMIMPRTEERLESWFEKYGRFVVQRAEMAEREGVDVFMIGSELNALATTLPADEPPGLEEYYLNEDKQQERRNQVLAQESLTAEGFDSVESYIDARIATEQAWARAVTGGDAEDLETINRRRGRLEDGWEALIAKVRRVYSGRIGFAANFDQYTQIGFWPSLDVIGINAYFKLRDRVLPDESEEHLYPLLLDGWRQVLDRIDGFRNGQGLGGKPVIFTEMGFTYRAKSTINPWADEGFALVDGPGAGKRAVVWRDQPVRYEERAWAVRALWQAHSELTRPFLEGILYWKLSSHDYHLDDESFMVHIGSGSDDPALPELRRFLGPSS